MKKKKLVEPLEVKQTTPTIILKTMDANNELLFGLQMVNQTENTVTCSFSLENSDLFVLVRTGLKVKSPWHMWQWYD